MPPSPGGDQLEELNAVLAGRYRVERVLGRGGMASVYLAEDLRHERPVAIKLIHPQLAHEMVADRFIREIRIEARLTHPNIITLLDSGVVELPGEPPRPYYVMPFVRGESLRERLRREGSLPVSEAVRITLEVAGALAYAHEQGVVHRDIKPENVLLVSGHAVVADFGVARLVDRSQREGLTSSGGLPVGTPEYMSPEQWAADPRLDARSDIYSLGCVLYEMLAGGPPFTGPSFQAIRARHAADRPPPIRTVRESTPEALQHVVEKCLAKLPADRYQAVAELIEALESSHGEPASVRPGRQAWKVGLGVLAAAAAVVALWMLTRPAVALSPTRYAVLPFREADGAGPVSGYAAARELQNALGHWEDIQTVDPLRLADELRQHGEPQSVDNGYAVARRLGAARLVWGEIRARGDSMFVEALVYDTRRNRTTPLSRASIGFDATSLSRAFGQLAMSLIGGVVPGAERTVGGTNSLEGLQAYAAGEQALAAWDMERAAEHLRAALVADPSYPQANLRLAQIYQWTNRPPTEWRSLAVTALRGGDHLARNDSVQAAALVAFADGRFPESCALQRSLIARDSLEFAAWFGLGECQARDRVVMRDPRSPSGWRFRSSYENAIQAYARALSLVPSTHLAYQGTAFDRLGDLLFTETNHFRPGRAAEPDSGIFGSFPALVADTLAFVPWPIEAVYMGRPEALPATRHDAVRRNQGLLRDIAGSWVRAFPASVPALSAWAAALEAQGDLTVSSPEGPSALEAVRTVRRQGGGPAGSLPASVWEARLLIKAGRFNEAGLLVDSLLSGATDVGTLGANALAGPAAVAGRITLAIDLLTRSTGVWPDRSDAPTVPRPVEELGLRLLGFAAFGRPADSIRAGYDRLTAATRGLPLDPPTQGALNNELTRIRQLAWPVLPVSRETGGYLGPVFDGLARNDTAAVLAHFRTIREARAGQGPGDVSLDAVLLESRLLLAAGDSLAARTALDVTLDALHLAGTDLLVDVPQTAALPRALILSAELALAAGDQNLARSRAAAVAALWRQPDPVLATTFTAVRTLTGQ